MSRNRGNYWDDEYGQITQDLSGKKDEINQYKIQLAPPNGLRVLIEPNLYFVKNVSRDQDKQSNPTVTVTTTIQIIATGRGGPGRVDDFCDRALKHYKEVEGLKDDGARYLYSPVSFPGKGCADKASILFKRYRLSDDKTFASFFHPEKEALITLLDQFTTKKGKFAIPGYPQKLGILLDGPPGTGKTSLIKAMAHHLKRNIISIPLEKVETNQDLMDLVFDQSFTIKEDDWTYNLPFHKTIFVLEDIDAAAKVVLKRTDDQMLNEDQGPSKMAHHITEILSQTVESKTERGSGRQLPDDSKDVMSFWKNENKDKLNLAGLLNVLDGVVDCPERIVIMSTNHPELLDPALIRPGRINKKMHLGLLESPEAMLMVEHYFPGIGTGQKASLRESFPEKEISPAALECLCAKCDNIEDLIACLEEGKNNSSVS